MFAGGGIISSLGKKIASSLNGVENVYTQHQPLLYYILESIVKGKLKDSAYPPITSGSGGAASTIPSEVIVFIIGGATFEEATKVIPLTPVYLHIPHTPVYLHIPHTIPYSYSPYYTVYLHILHTIPV